MPIYPLATIPNQRQIWSWISYDVANQSFTLLINTLLFSVFFAEVVVTEPARSSTLWAITYAVSMALTVIASPVAGTIADARAWKKPALMLTGVLCAALTCALAFIKPGQLWLAMLLYIPANFAFSIGENFLASFLPELADRRHFGRVSGFSWGVAYAAALLILILAALAMSTLNLANPNQWRPFFVFAGLWFFLFMIPTALFLRERPLPQGSPRINVFTAGFSRLARSIADTRKFRDLAVLLIASLFYGTGMSVVIFFASLIAKEFGFTGPQLVVFVGVITISGIVGTLVPTILQDRIGHKRSTVLLLLVWIAAALVLALYAYLRAHAPDPANYPNWPMWAIGNALGFGLGSLGSANRAFVGFLAPADRSAEVFGLWGMVFKLAAILTIPFAIVRDKLGTPASLLVLAGFLVAGLLITLFVDEHRGARAAHAQHT